VKRFKFDGSFPETIPAEHAQWATLIPGRNPQFKIHTNLGLAHSAIGQRNLGERFAIYKLVDGSWELEWHYEPYDNCDRCGKPFRDQAAWVHSHGRKLEGQHIKGGPTKRVWEGANIICEPCYNSDRATANQEYQEAQERKRLAELRAKYPD
jgi:hypothetical protein